MTALRLIYLAVALWVCAGIAFAHEVRPAFLRVVETGANQHQVTWKQPVISGRRLKITPVFPDHCRLGERRLRRAADTVTESFTLQCDLSRGTIRLDGLERTLTDVFVDIRSAEGEVRTALIKPSDTVMSLDGPQASPARDYLRIGVDHIIYGWDHLLFVIGLTLLVRPKQVFGVATSFTLAHSITLAGTALLGWSLPGTPVEILIAASIVLLAIEILRKVKGRPSLSAKRPYLVGFLIGLIHGFGFAGALAEIGLPQGTELLALLLFNLGVELGQFAVVAAGLALLWALAKWLPRVKPKVEIASAYALGTVAMFWVVQRVDGFIFPV